MCSYCFFLVEMDDDVISGHNAQFLLAESQPCQNIYCLGLGRGAAPLCSQASDPGPLPGSVFILWFRIRFFTGMRIRFWPKTVSGALHFKLGEIV